MKNITIYNKDNHKEFKIKSFSFGKRDHCGNGNIRIVSLTGETVIIYGSYAGEGGCKTKNPSTIYIHKIIKNNGFPELWML